MRFTAQYDVRCVAKGEVRLAGCAHTWELLSSVPAVNAQFLPPATATRPSPACDTELSFAPFSQHPMSSGSLDASAPLVFPRRPSSSHNCGTHVFRIGLQSGKHAINSEDNTI